MPERPASDWRAHLQPHLAGLTLSPVREAEIVEELSQHLDQRYDELRARGTSEVDAERAALAELLDAGTLARHMRALRQARTPRPIAPGMPQRSFLGDLLQDVRYAGRTLRRQPGFTAAAVLTLGLGIGANSAIFSLVDAAVLKPLPYREPDRLVMLWERTAASSRGRVAPPNLVDWRTRSRTFEAMGAAFPGSGGMVMRGAEGMAETVSRQWVTAGFFDVLGVTPVVGRLFQPEDDAARARIVVLSEGFWRSRFGGDPDVVGREIRLDGTPYTIVGVAPREFQWIGRASLWALFPIEGAPFAARSAYVLQVVGRLRPDATLSAADADLAAVAEGLAREFPTTNAGRRVALEPLQEAIVGRELRTTSLLFVGVVGVVLLICCANVANLLLARATARTRELAIRSALGADRSRVVRQMLTESLVLAALGGAGGLAVGWAILAVAPSMVPQGVLPPAIALTFDVRVAAFGVAAALLVGLLFGLAPAWQSSRLALANAMSEDGRTTSGAGGRLRRALVAGEVATAVLLLVGAGLLVRTVIAVDRVDRGYQVESALTMIVDPLDGRYPSQDALVRFFDTIATEVAALPGVRNVAWASTVPMGFSYVGRWLFDIEGAPPAAEGERPTADYQIVSATYFETLDLPLVAGRGFNEFDTRDAVPVCIVNEAFVRRHLQGRSPIGARVVLRQTAERAPVVREIVGVARQVKERPDEIEDLVQVYVPLTQHAVGDLFLVVRPDSGPAEALTPAVRGAIGRVDAEQLVSVRNVMTLDEVAREATTRHRFRAVLVTTFAGLALLLAMVGVAGILAYAVQQRAREFGVRRALGATTGDVLWLVAGSALRMTATGALIGLALATALGRVLAGLLFGVAPLDTLTFAAVATALGLTTVVAAAGPAWRAIRIDPAVALRGE